MTTREDLYNLEFKRTYVIPSGDVTSQIDQSIDVRGSVFLHCKHQRGHTGRLKNKTYSEQICKLSTRNQMFFYAK